MNKTIIIVLISLFTTSFGQELKLGFRTEIFSTLYHKTNTYENDFNIKPTLLPNLYFVLASKPFSNLQIDIRPGYSASKNYLGFELGIYTKYFISQKLYLLGSLNSHFMGGEAHGTFRINETTFLLPGIGIGTQITKYASFEFMFFIPFPQEWSYEYSFDGEFKKITSKFDIIFKIGIGFDWAI